MGVVESGWEWESCILFFSLRPSSRTPYSPRVRFDSIQCFIFRNRNNFSLLPKMQMMRIGGQHKAAQGADYGDSRECTPHRNPRPACCSC